MLKRLSNCLTNDDQITHHKEYYQGCQNNCVISSVAIKGALLSPKLTPTMSSRLSWFDTCVLQTEGMESRKIWEFARKGEFNKICY